MRDRLLLKDLVPGKPSTWNRHALTFVYGPNDNSADVPVELVYPDETLSIGCKAKAVKYSYNNYADNNDALESINNSTLVVFVSKKPESGSVFRNYKKLNLLIAIFTIYFIVQVVLRSVLGHEFVGGHQSLILNFIMALSHLFCVGFMFSRKESLLFVHILSCNTLLCISSVLIKTIVQVLAISIQLLICYYSIDALKKEISHIFITHNVQQ